MGKPPFNKNGFAPATTGHYLTKDFVVRINKDFEENMGTPYKILGEKWGFGSIKVKPVDEKDL